MDQMLQETACGATVVLGTGRQVRLLRMWVGRQEGVDGYRDAGSVVKVELAHRMERALAIHEREYEYGHTWLSQH